MGSFKLKLFLWFALLALLPLAVAFYGYDSLAKRSETRRVDAGLQSSLRAAVAGYSARLEAASAQAAQLAADPRLQPALRGRDATTLRRAVALVPGASITGRGLSIGSRVTPAGVRSVTVTDGGTVLGRVSVRVPVDQRLLTGLAASLSEEDELVATRAGRVIAGRGKGQRLAPLPGQPTRVDVASDAFRALATAPLAEPDGLEFVALSPQSAIDAAARKSERGILIVLAGSLTLIAIVTYLLGRSIVRTLRRLSHAAHALASGDLDERVEVRGRDEFADLASAFNDMATQLQQRLVELETERTRVRDAAQRFGEALVATHDPNQLLQVIVETAVEATGADGGLVLGREGELVRIGDPEAPGERIAFPLRAGGSDFGSLVITAAEFDADQVEAAASLAAQAVVALENARLHRIVERQALFDSLTGLANRRRLEETMRVELARAARFHDQVCVVIADLDDFKRVNDTYGHAVGDEVLKEFARALRSTVRESDIAGRWGGEEFVLVLTGTDTEGGARLAERAREAIESRSVRAPNGDLVAVTASFGVAASFGAGGLEDLLAAADSALYQAKHAGKNRVVVSTGSAAPRIV
jgi:diguanylate cyclase (GGDEF)-like protein